jgi:hypothetical protein
MLRATFQTQSLDLQARAEKSALLDDARGLLRLREELAGEEQRLAERRMGLARRYLAGAEPERVPVPAGEFASWFDGKAADGGA